MLHYIVALPFEAFNPDAISAGIDAWSWVISEKPEYEIALVSRLVSAWNETIKLRRGIFSSSLEYVDFYSFPSLISFGYIAMPIHLIVQ